MKRDPQLDLGMLVYARDTEGGLTLYEGDPKDPTLPPKAPPPSDEGDDPDVGGDPGAGGDDLGDDEDAKFNEKFQKCMKRYFGGDMGGKGVGPPAMPPPPGGAPLPPPDQRNAQPANFQRIQERRMKEEVQRLKREVQSLQSQRTEDSQRYAREATEQLLNSLDTDYGERIDPALAKIIRDKAVVMNHDERRNFESMCRGLLGEPSPDRGPNSRGWLPTGAAENYARLPASGARDDARGEVAEDFTVRDQQAAEAFMRKNPGCEWEAAEKYAMEQKRTRWTRG